MVVLSRLWFSHGTGVPSASSNPTPPPDDTTNQFEGKREVSQVRGSYGDFLEKPENDAFQNRLDAIEDKYRRAAAMEDEAAVNPNVGYEQASLIAEADSELQQLNSEIGEAWERSLSTNEQKLFNNQPQATIDEMQMHIKQWDRGTFDDVAHSIVYHALKKGYTNYLQYLRDASNFNIAAAHRNPPQQGDFRNDDTAQWDNFNTGEYIIIDKNGKIRTYGRN